MVAMPVAYPESYAATADGAARATAGWFFGADLQAGTGASATLILYDNASAASGTIIARLAAVANEADHVCADPPLRVVNGIYADVGGSGAAYVVRHA